MIFKNLLRILESYGFSLIKIINSNRGKRSILLIFVNCNNSILKSLKNIHCIETYYINDKKGFSIYNINNK